MSLGDEDRDASAGGVYSAILAVLASRDRARVQRMERGRVRSGGARL